jgi:hypothetical protein
MGKREVDRVLEGVDRRLDAGSVVHDDLDALGFDPRPDALRVPEGGDAGIGDEHRPAHAQAPELPTRLLRGSCAELHRGGFDGEDRFVVRGHRSPRV